MFQELPYRKAVKMPNTENNGEIRDNMAHTRFSVSDS